MVSGNPQIEDGYTRIANELYAAILLAKINLTELKVLLLILRLTYGFRRKKWPIRLSEFQKYTGIARQNCWRSLKSLAEKNMVTVISTDYSLATVIRGDYRQAKTYEINKKYRQWVPPVTVINLITDCNQLDYSCGVVPYSRKEIIKKGGKNKSKKGGKPGPKFKPRHEWHFANPTLIPDDFHLSDDLKEFGSEKLTEAGLASKINLENFTASFRLTCLSNDKKYKDWKATWKGWLLREIGWAKERTVNGKGQFGVY